jgi:hypothetical protein
VWLEIDPDTGRLSEVDPPDTPDMAQRLSAAAATKDAILAALPFQTKQDAARKVGKHPDNDNFKAAWKALRDSGQLVKNEQGGWWGGP